MEIVKVDRENRVITVLRDVEIDGKKVKGICHFRFNDIIDLFKEIRKYK